MGLTENKKNLSALYKGITPPVLSSVKKYTKISPGEFVRSDKIIEFLEKRSPLYEFEYAHVKKEDPNLSLGYEIKTVEKISAIYLMINPDPLNFALVPPNSLVICHHKIGVYNNRIYKKILQDAQKNQINIYNYHLGWDTMEHGVGDSFLFHLGFKKNEFEKVDLTYKGVRIKNLGAIVKKAFSFEKIVSELVRLNVNPSVILNPKCNIFNLSKLGYIPGGGFDGQMVVEMADLGVDVLISSDHNWVVETIARELDMTLIEIDHYSSERYGLHTMRKILKNAFSTTPITILENIDNVECGCENCSCCSSEYSG